VTRTPAPPPWRSRIVGHGEVAPVELVPNPRNWRTHPADQQAALSGALAEVGWVAEVTVNQTTGHVVDGHLRIELALAWKEPTVPVTYVELAEDEERLVLASLDPLAAMAEAEATRLAELLEGLDPGDAALRALLDDLARENDLESLRRGFVDPDDVPDLPDPADCYVKPGDLWQLGDHRLLCGDATKQNDVTRLLAGATPWLLVTDPPYGVELNLEWRDDLASMAAPAEKSYLRSEGHGNTGISGDTRADWSAAFEIVPSLEVAYVWHADRHALEVGAGLERIGFVLRQQVIWVKPFGIPSRTHYNSQHEPCWYAVKQGATAEWVGDTRQTTVIEAPSPKMMMGGSDEEKFDHPTQKPAECMARPIRNHRGDVYEPFAGSGTTIVAAETLGRRCYGLEIEPRYVQVAIERWQRFSGREAVRLDG
jgi:DNA modification methylase